MSIEEKKATEVTKEVSVTEQIEKLKNTPEFAAILNQHGKTYHELKAEETAASFMGKAYTNVDSAYMEELGLTEKPKGKTADIVRQIAKENKAMKAKLEGEQPKNETQNEEKEQLHNSQLSAMKKMIEELQEKNQTLEVKGKHQKAKNSLASGLVGAMFNPNLGSNLLDETKANRINNAVQNSKEIDGKIVFYKNDGDPYTNLNGLPMSAKEVGHELFKDILFVKKAGGSATNEEKAIIKGDIVVLPNIQNIKTFAQFNDEFAKAMQAKGLTRKDDKYYELQRATRDHYKLAGLPSE